VSKLSPKEWQQLLLDDEWLRNRDKDVDEAHRRTIESTRPLTPEEAACRVFDDENATPRA
jgi:hypothetical protein